MHLSRLFGKTLRQPPSDAHLLSHQLLIRAGFVRALESGFFAYLPLGMRALQRLQSRLQDRLAVIGGQEIAVPIHGDSDFGQMLAELAHREIDSYRQLPVIMYGMTTHVVTRASSTGLFGTSQRPTVRVVVFGDRAVAPVVSSIFEPLRALLDDCSAPVLWAHAGTDQVALFAHPSGDTEFVRCGSCGYVAERSWASVAWDGPSDDPFLPPEEIYTPGCNTIASLAEFLGIPAARTLKMVFCTVEGQVTCAVIRGDRMIDDDKLARALGTRQFRASLETELAAIGAVGGYASPIGLDPRSVRVLADLSVRTGRNSVSGANRPDYHIRNVNVPRDFEPGAWADLAQVEPGDPCPACGAALELGVAFVLARNSGLAPCQPDAQYLDKEGRGQSLWAAGWSVDLARVLAAVVETHHDEYGIVWPISCAPFDVHLVVLDSRKEGVQEQADALVLDLESRGLAVLIDDRDASAGVKFNDADLIGIPLRLTVSKRSAKEGLVEVKWRNLGERLKLNESELGAELARLRTT